MLQTNPSLGEAGKQVVYGPHRVFPGRLSVSRTLGDIEAKITRLDGNPNVVIADPDVTAFEIKDNHDFIVIGCDGVFDKLSSKDCIHMAWQKVLMEASKDKVKKVDLEQTHRNCGHCVDGILRAAALRRTVDNVTCVVAAFDGFQKQLQHFLANGQDGTTVDVIEEIQLEPIPEHLSSQKTPVNPKRPDDSMLLADDYKQADFQAGYRGPLPNAANKKAQILSEIAEEDDVSSLSETLRQPGALQSGSKMGSRLAGSFAHQGKGSIHSQHQTTRHDGDAPALDLKRHSQLVNKPETHELIEEQNVQIRDPQLIPPPAISKSQLAPSGVR